jgi:predicted phage tail protein
MFFVLFGFLMARLMDLVTPDIEGMKRKMNEGRQQAIERQRAAEQQAQRQAEAAQQPSEPKDEQSKKDE